MKCNDVAERLSPYIDEVLEKEEMEEITDHLANCDSCGKIYQDLLDMIQQLSAVEEMELPDSFEFRLKRALSEERKAKNKTRINWRFASSIAAVFVIGLLTYGMYGDLLPIGPDKLAGGGSSGTVNLETASLSDMAKEELEEQYGMMSLGKEKEASMPREEVSADNVQPLKREATSLALVPAAEEAAPAEAFSLENQGLESQSMAADSSETRGLMSDSAAVKYYSNLIEERLADFDYEIYDYTYETNGEWRFNAVIFNDAEGNTYNAEVLITGKDGEITFKSEEEIKGL